MRRNRGRNGGRANVPRNMLSPRHVHYDMYGYVPRGPQDPPRVLLTPWNSIVLSTTLIGGATASSACVTYANLLTYFTAQTALSGSINFRIARASVWQQVPSGEINNQVTARFFDLSASATGCSITDTLSHQIDHGTPARLANVHYVWPKFMQQLSHSATSATPFMRVTLLSAQQVLLHIHCLWRGSGVGTNLTEESILDNCLCDVSALKPGELHRCADLEFVTS